MPKARTRVSPPAGAGRKGDDEHPPAVGPMGLLPGSYSSVSEMVRSTRGDVAADALDADEAARRLTDALAIQRALRGIPQATVAASMGCGQAKVSKMERAPDASVPLGDVVAYAAAIGMRLRLVLEPRGADRGAGLDVEVERAKGLPEAAPSRKGRGRPVGAKGGR